MNHPRRALNPSERLDWLRLIRSENVGPVTFRQLLGRFGSARAALDALPELARRGGRPRPLQVFPRAAAERELAAIDRLGAHLLASIEPDYPLALAAIDDAPPLIAVRGHRHLLGRRSIAIVGARNASANGRRFAATLATSSGQAGLVVVSGLARGIDAAAHRGSLATGTIAVLAGGIDIVYPPEHEALQAEVGESGALVAELPPAPRPRPATSRAAIGSSRACRWESSWSRRPSDRARLITARFALEQGREVFAVPGSPLDPRCPGANDLIREGATLVETVADILTVLAAVKAPLAEPADDSFAAGTPVAVGEETLASARKAVVELLGPSPVAVDELVRQCPLSPARRPDRAAGIGAGGTPGTPSRQPGFRCVNRIRCNLREPGRSRDQGEGASHPSTVRGSMNVVVVESPAKAKTINKYLGPDYKVIASYGHVRDLPPKDGSVRPDDDFAMVWEVDGKAEAHLKEIAQAVRGADSADPRHRPRPRGRGDLLAYQRGAEAPARARAASTSSASSSTR